MKYLSTTLLGLAAGIVNIALSIAYANIDVRIINDTVNKKPLQFSITQPNANQSTELQTVQDTYHFDLNTALEPDCEQHKLCNGNRYWIVFRKWGLQTIFVRCPKIYNPKDGTTQIDVRVFGNDSSSLYCSISQRKSNHKTADL